MALDPARLFAVLAHELRAPIGVARGYLRLLQQGNPRMDDARATYVTHALGALERLAGLVDETSELARLLGGELGLVRTPCSVPVVLADSLTSLGDRASRVALAAGDDLVVDADRSRLSAALAALIEGVVRAQTAGATVQVSWARAGADAVITMTGPRARVRSGRSPAASAPGTGAIRAEIVVSLHGGRLDEARRADGAVHGVVVHLPLA
ncbi:MAG: histidine kinase dimerization/phospho-acceptor domain-containing protein [Acidobacteriota bacterium]